MREKGQSLVEFSISLVVILILLAGAVELGIVLFQYIQLRDAAQEGAVYGSICQNEDKIKDRARNASSSPLDLEKDASVDVEFVDEDGDGDYDATKVTMLHIHKVFMPFASAFIGNEVSVRVSVVNTVLARGNCE